MKILEFKAANTVLRQNQILAKKIKRQICEGSHKEFLF